MEPFALDEYICIINEIPDVDFIYSNHDYISRRKNRRFCPVFKPSPASETLYRLNYVGDVWVVRREFISGLSISSVNCLSLEVSLHVCKMKGRSHCISRVLFHVSVEREDERAIEFSGGCDEVLTSYIKSGTDTGFSLQKQNPSGIYSVNYILKSTPLISIIIPNKDNSSVLKKCTDSILSKSTYRNFEIVIAENGSVTNQTFLLYDNLKKKENIKIITIPGKFNYSRVNNRAVAESSGDVLIFLNNDTEVITPQWMEKMLCHALKTGTAAVGAKLYYPDGTIQHGGLVLGFGGVAGDPFQGADGRSDGYLYALQAVRNVSAVTGACLMLRRELFDHIGGFDESLPLAYNDVDLCLRLNAAGFETIWSPESELRHYESVSRGYDITAGKKLRLKNESDIFTNKWKAVLQKGDPHFSSDLYFLYESF